MIRIHCFKVTVAMKHLSAYTAIVLRQNALFITTIAVLPSTATIGFLLCLKLKIAKGGRVVSFEIV